MSEGEELARACVLGARTALAMAEMMKLAVGLIALIPDTDVARAAFDEIKRINDSLAASVEAFDSDEVPQ